MLAPITWVLANRPMKRNMEGYGRLFTARNCSARRAKSFPRPRHGEKKARNLVVTPLKNSLPLVHTVVHLLGSRDTHFMNLNIGQDTRAGKDQGRTQQMRTSRGTRKGSRRGCNGDGGALQRGNLIRNSYHLYYSTLY